MEVDGGGSNDGGGGGDSGSGLSPAQQKRLQQMISMQHAQQDQMRRYGSVDGGRPAPSGPATAASPLPPPPLGVRNDAALSSGGIGGSGSGRGGGGGVGGAPDEIPLSVSTRTARGGGEPDDLAMSISTSAHTAVMQNLSLDGDKSGGGGGGGGGGAIAGGMHFHGYSRRSEDDMIRAAAAKAGAEAAGGPRLEDTPPSMPLAALQRARRDEQDNGGRDENGGGDGSSGMHPERGLADGPLRGLFGNHNRAPQLGGGRPPSHGYDGGGGAGQKQPNYYQALAPPEQQPRYPPAYATGHGPHLGGAASSQTGLSLTDIHHSHSEHQFHYGNPDHAYDTYSGPEFPLHHGHGSDRPSCGLFRAITGCFRTLATAENLHRSLCFGAIDGMLTGSGITAACAGLGYLSPGAALYQRLAVAALSVAACASDGVCMAIGHVWSTYVLHHASLRERREERTHFAQNRAEAKSRLVDMLIGRGMLKIDAMSIADTLEGYPDIFVSALVGDSGHALGDPSDGNAGGGPGGTNVHGSGALGLAKSGSRGDGAHGLLNPEDGDARGHYAAPLHHPAYGAGQTTHSAANRSMGRRAAGSGYYGSYGQFNEFEEDPDMASMHLAMKDGWSEGAIMMVSFCLFSVVPSLVFIFVPVVFPHNSYSHASYYGSRDGGTSATTISMGIISTVMLLLGVWKSHFFDSNWVIFGIETVLVLLLCVACAYSIGYGFSCVLP